MARPKRQRQAEEGRTMRHRPSSIHRVAVLTGTVLLSGCQTFSPDGVRIEIGSIGRRRGLDSPSRFPANWLPKSQTPVTLPLGRLRLAQPPPFTRSSPMRKTMGMVAVSALAARGPAVMSTALTGRTHGCTDQGCKREESSCQGAVHT